MRMTKEDTMAIIVDYQEKLVPAMHETVQLIKSAVVLVKGLKKLGIPMVVSQQYTKGLGETIAKVKDELPEDCKFIEKNTFTVYNEENKALIDSYGKKNIIVCGTETHICVLQTAIDLIAAGYNVFFPVDCVGSRTAFNKDCGIKRLMCEGGFITSAEAVLFELAYSSKDEAFKTISDLIK